MEGEDVDTYAMTSYPRNVSPHALQGVYGLNYFLDARHREYEHFVEHGPDEIKESWRLRERMRTSNVALVLCLNIGVDPPDVIKTSPCARMECWIDPRDQQHGSKVLEQIGKGLQLQYERWQSRARYKQCLDPAMEDVKKMCLSLRRNAKEERVLFHYNGHGVPKPTANGEVWVFNKSYTQYIPLSVFELQQWLQSPCIYVFDCSASGVLVDSMLKYAAAKDRENTAGARSHTAMLRETIMLAACSANETLPTNPSYPADIFTACLTTPIKIALRWFCQRSRLLHIDPNIVDSIPGRLTDRKSPLGELNWCFTATTDTIAWNVLEKSTFKKLFRQDLLVASLFRNYLLAERILTSAGCTPVSHPKIPATFKHPMWEAWDHAAELCLSQINRMLTDPLVKFRMSNFFTEHLTAFEVWLDFGHERKDAPEQLPIVLQVLLSQIHRLRALTLLGRFLDMGPWAVNLALSVGIFPYVVKLLQSPASDLRHTLVFIWSKILVVDPSCRRDLIVHKEDSEKKPPHEYFVSFFSTLTIPPDQRAIAAFVLTVIVNGFPKGQDMCLRSNLVSHLLAQITDANALLRTWICLCLGKLWEGSSDAKARAIRAQAPEAVCRLFQDPVPEVRAAAVFAMGTFMGGAEGSPQKRSIEVMIGLSLLNVAADGSPLVRRELVIALAAMVQVHLVKFREVTAQLLREKMRRAQANAEASRGGGNGSGAGGGGGSSNNASGSGGAGGSGGGSGGGGSGSSSVPQAVPSPGSSPGSSAGSASGSPGLRRGRSMSGNSVHAADESPAARLKLDISYVHIWRVIGALACDPVGYIAKPAAAIKQLVLEGDAAAQRHMPAHLHPHKSLADMRRVNSMRNMSHMSMSVSPKGSARMGASPGPAGAAAGAAGAGMGPTAGTGTGGDRAVAGSLPNGAATAPAGRKSRRRPKEIKRTPSADSLRKKGVEDGRLRWSSDVFRSCLFEWCARHFQQPLIQTHLHEQLHMETDPVVEKHRQRHRRYRHVIHAAERMANDECVALGLATPASLAAGSSGLDDDTGSVSSFGVGGGVGLGGEHSLGGLLGGGGGGGSGGGGGKGSGSGGSNKKKKKLSFDQQIAILDNEQSMTTALTFFSFVPLLAVADGADGVHIWNYDEGRKARFFGNHNPVGTRVTQLKVINEGDDPLLLVGSADGVVRFWSNCAASDAAAPPKLVAAWRTIPEIVPGSRGPGLVCEWQQHVHYLFSSGAYSFIRLWDVEREVCVQDMPTNTDTAVNALTSDQLAGGRLLVAGCGDGSVRLFDYRIAGSGANVETLQGHRAWVVNVHLQRGGLAHLLSADAEGKIKLWDMRKLEPFQTIAAHKTNLTAMSSHNYMPLLASGSANQHIKVFDQRGNTLNMIRYHDGFLGQRIGPISCLAFHPLRPILAAGAIDPIVSIYSGEGGRGRK